MCQCSFNKSNVDEESFTTCNDQFPEYVSFQARLTATSVNNSEYLISLLEQWVLTSPNIFVNGLLMKIVNAELNCITLLSNLGDEDCVSELSKKDSKIILIVAIVTPIVGLIGTCVTIVSIIVAIVTGKYAYKNGTKNISVYNIQREWEGERWCPSRMSHYSTIRGKS